MESAGGVASEVAVKVLRADINPGSDSVKRLRDEGRLLGKLSHPSIVKVHDLVVLDGRVSLVCEFVEGEDLDQCFKGTDAIPARALVAVIGEVASALHAAWDSPSPTSGEPLRLVHRDVKPANIRLGRHGEVKLLDFGIARAGNAAREAQTAANAMMGSYLYMAPERFHEDIVQPPSDIFALGSVLYEGLSGERFFGGMSLQQVYAFMLSSSRFKKRLEERLAELALDVDDRVLALIREMMAADPEARPTAAQIATRCEDLAEELSGTTLKRWARRRDWPDFDLIHGSLDGRVLTAGVVGTEAPPPVRQRRATPVATSGRIANGPPSPAGQYSPPPPSPQALGSLPVMGELGLHDEPTEPMADPPEVPRSTAPEPRMPTHAPQAVSDQSLGNEPGLGDFSRARADIAGQGPAFSMGGHVETETQDWGTEIESTKRKRSVWSMVIAVGLVGMIALGVGSVAAFVALQNPEWVGLGADGGDQPIPVDAVPGTDEEGNPETGEDEPAEDADEGSAATDDAPDGEDTPDGEDAPDGEDTPEPAPEAEPEPAPAPAAEPDPAPAPEPRKKTAASLSSQGWNKMGSDPGAASQLFQEAIALDGSYGEAHYGYGYALVKLGQPDAGKASLCRAKGLVGSATVNEIDGFLAQQGLSCE